MTTESDDRYVAVILDQPGMGTEWMSWLTVELSLRGLLLQADGSLEEAGLLLGLFRFLDRGETERVIQTARVEIEALQCPWAGPVRGAIEWVRVRFEEDLLRSFLPFLARLGRGPFIRVRDGACHQPVRRISFALDELFGKRGFDDGEALLSSSPEYLEYVRAEIDTQLKWAGLRAQLGMSNTLHNPVRLRGSILQDGKEVPESVLYGLSVELWAHDWQFLHDVSFW